MVTPIARRQLRAGPVRGCCSASSARRACAGRRVRLPAQPGQRGGRHPSRLRGRVWGSPATDIPWEVSGCRTARRSAGQAGRGVRRDRTRRPAGFGHPLRPRAGDRHRRYGAGAPRHRHAARPAGGGEGVPARRGSRACCPHRERGSHAGLGAASRSRLGLRRRDVAARGWLRGPVPGDGARRRADAGRVLPGRHAGGPGGHGHRRRARRRARARAQPRDRPPGRQARQHPARPRSSPQAHRLRDRPARRQRPAHPDRDYDRNGGLPEPGADLG